MRTNEIIETAGIVSLQERQGAVLIAQLPEKVQLERAYQYWLANRQRFQAWEIALDQLETSYYSSVNPLPEGLFEEIIAGELLSRLTYSWFCCLDQVICAEKGDPVFASIGKNVLQAHEAVVQRVFGFLLQKETRSTHFRTVWYNQLRRTTRHWKLSLERYMTDSFMEEASMGDCSLFGGANLDEASGFEAGSEWGNYSSSAVAESRLCWKALQPALQVSFLLWNRPKPANPACNRQIVHSVLDLIPAEGKQALFQYPECLEERVVDAADDMQYLLDSYWESTVPVQDLFVQRLLKYAG